MRLVGVVTGALIVILGASAAITGEFSGSSSWVFVICLATLGTTGLVATATAVSR